MALVLITNPPSALGSDTDWATLLTRSNANMLGHGLRLPIFTLTNWDGSTTQPQIAEDSIIEVGGSFYQADADTPLVDDVGLVDGTVHIKLVPGAGSPDPLTVVPTLTNDALPVWDVNKAGWYDGADKFLPFEMTKASAVFTEKDDIIHQSGAKAIFPVGHVYTQYPGKKSPSELKFLGTWTSFNFSGDFFRSEGGDASAFESGQQGDVIKNHTHPYQDNSATGTTNAGSGAFPLVPALSNVGKTTSNNNGGSADETRPKNRTIKLWERTL